MQLEAIDVYYFTTRLYASLGVKIDEEKLIEQLNAVRCRRVTLLGNPAESGPEAEHARKVSSLPDGRYEVDLDNSRIAAQILAEMGRDQAEPAN